MTSIRLRGRGYLGAAVAAQPTISTGFYNGAKPATHAITVTDQTDLFNQLTALSTSAPATTLYLAGKSHGANFAADYGSGRKHRLPTKAFTNPITIRAADHDDMPLFQAGEVANWMRHGMSNIIWDGIEFYDDETYATPSTTRSIFYNAGDRTNETLRRCYVHQKNLNVYRDDGLKAIDWRMSGLTIDKCVFSELKCALVLNTGTSVGNISVTDNSFLRTREHTLKGAGSFAGWTITGNVFDGWLPGYSAGAYIEHANAVYLSGNNTMTLTDFLLQSNLFISDVDHSHAGFIRAEPVDPNVGTSIAVANNIKVKNNDTWGGIPLPIAFAKVQGTGNEMSGNTMRHMPGALGEVADNGMRASSSQFDRSGNRGPFTDDDGLNTITNTGAANNNTSISIATLQLARDQLEAAALALQLKTVLTLGL